MLLTRNWGHAGGANAIWHYRFFGGPDAPLGMFDESHGMMVESASPSSFLVSEVNIMRGRFIVVALPYTKGTTFTVHAHLYGRDFVVPRAVSQAAVLAPEEQLLDPRVDAFPADACENTVERPQWGRYDNWAVCAMNATAAPTGPSWYFNATTGMLYVRVVNLASHIGPDFYDPLLPERLVTRRNRMQLGEIERNWQFRVNASCDGAYGMCRNGRYVPGASRSHGDSCKTTEQRTWVGWGFGNSVIPPRHDLEKVVLCGGSTGLWQPPSIRRGVLWPDLAGVRTARAGDRLSFTSETGHDIVQLPSRAAYEACDLSGGRTLYTFVEWAYAFELNLTLPGIYYFVSGQADHCARGQKIIVNVTTSAGVAALLEDAPFLNTTDAPMYVSPMQKATCSTSPTSRYPPSACPGGAFPQPDASYVAPSPPLPPPVLPPCPPIPPPAAPLPPSGTGELFPTPLPPLLPTSPPPHGSLPSPAPPLPTTFPPQLSSKPNCLGCSFSCQVYNSAFGRCVGAQSNRCPCSPTPPWCAS